LAWIAALEALRHPKAKSKPFFAPLGLYPSPVFPPHGLRRGLHSFAALRLGTLSRFAAWTGETPSLH